MDPTFLPRPYKSCPEDDGDSKLHQACFKGGYESALMLILSGEDIIARNVWDQTPLHHCTSQGHLEVMLLLLDSGASVNAVDHQNLTPLHQAIIHSNKHAAELLLCYGASVHNHNSVTDGTRSVLELAGHVHVCHKVIEEASGHVWPLQHLCRIAVRQSLGAARRKRMKELPVPKHLLSYLCSLPVARSDLLHQNWERVRSNKCEAIRKKGASRRLHQRLEFNVLAISAGRSANMAGVIGKYGGRAREAGKGVDGACGGDKKPISKDKRGVETGDRDVGGSETENRDVGGSETENRDVGGVQTEGRSDGETETEEREVGEANIGAADLDGAGTGSIYMENGSISARGLDEARKGDDEVSAVKKDVNGGVPVFDIHSCPSNHDGGGSLDEKEHKQPTRTSKCSNEEDDVNNVVEQQ